MVNSYELFVLIRTRKDKSDDKDDIDDNYDYYISDNDDDDNNRRGNNEEGVRWPSGFGISLPIKRSRDWSTLGALPARPTDNPKKLASVWGSVCHVCQNLAWFIFVTL